jgi:hypothetical protein
MKSNKKLVKDLKITIDVNEIALNSRKFTTSEISRGTGIHKSKKGRGSYTRKNARIHDHYY